MSEPDGGALDLLSLAALPMPEWPALARRWLAGGHYSSALVDFAEASPAEAHVLADVMFDVLDSLGVAVRSLDGTRADLFEVSGLALRCCRAIEAVSVDLEKTWDQFSLRVVTSSDEPPLFVQVMIGKNLSSSSDAMTAFMDDDELVAAAATQVSEAFLEEGYEWPSCIGHRRRMVVHTAAPGEPMHRPIWHCDGPSSHAVAGVGRLQANDAQSEALWWATDRQLDRGADN